MAKAVGSSHDGADSNLSVIEVSDQSGIVLNAEILFDADYLRLGDDLHLRSPDGEEILLRDYFASDAPPQLETAEGARLTPETVEGLAGPELPTAFAQTGSIELGQPIGEVNNLDGIARVQRADGSRADLREGDPIFQGDVVSTGVGSDLGILFVDDTIFSLSAGSRMLIDELIYSPGSTSNSMGVSLIQGTFVFVTGKVAPNGGMDVETPVGTIGIRGTTVGVQVSAFGGATRIANLINPETGELGSFVFSNEAGAALFSLANHFLDIRSANAAPGVPSVISGQDIFNAFGRALNKAVEIQRSLSQDQDDEPTDPTEEQEGEVDQLQALEAAGLTPEEIDALLNEPPIETAAGPTPQQPLGEGSSFGGGLTPPGLGDGEPTGVVGDTDIETSSPAPSPSDGNTEPPTLGGLPGDDDTPVNSAPTVSAPGTDGLEGGLVQIGPAAVSASDAETSDPSLLVYTVTAVSNGLVVLAVGEGFQVVFSFTQADIDNGLVFFAHDGSETTEGSFTVTVADPNGGVSAPAVVPIGVTPVDDAPVLLTNQLAVDEGGTVVLSSDNLNASDVDTNPGDLVFTVSDVTGGTFQLVGSDQSSFAFAAVQQQAAVTTFTQQQINSGQVIFVHDGGEAPPNYSVSVSDGTSTSPPQTVTVDFTSVNDAPVLENNSLSIAEGETVVLSGADLSATDVDDNNTDLVFTVSGVTGGRFALASDLETTITTFSQQQITDGEVVFIDDGDEQEPSYIVSVSDGDLSTAPAVAEIEFTPVNDDPVAQDDGFTVDEDESLEGDLLADNGNGADSDAENDELAVTAINGEDFTPGEEIELASGALLTVNADGSFNYDTNEQFGDLGGGDIIEESFSYEVSDGNGGSDTATVTITVEGENDAPIAFDDPVFTDEDSNIAGDVLADNEFGADFDLDGDNLTVTAVNGNTAAVGNQITLASGALLTLNADGTFSYDPNGQFESLQGGESGDPGEDSFQYTVSDGNGGSDTATVTITIDGVNDAPIAQDDDFSIGQNGGVESNLLADNGNGPDFDVEGDNLTITEINGAILTPGAVIELASGALLTVNADGSFNYDTNEEFDDLGADESFEETFSYEVSDGNGGSDTATVTITVEGENDAPTAFDDPFFTDEDSSLVGDVLADNEFGADTDPDENDALTVSAVNGNALAVGNQTTLASGALLTLNADGTFAYDPNEQFDGLQVGESGQDSFEYTISDGNGGTDTATVTVTIAGVNDAPEAEDDAFTIVGENGSLTLDLLADNGNGPDSDAEGDDLSVIEINGEVFSGGEQGSQIELDSGAVLIVNDDGTFDYETNEQFLGLGAGESAEDSFTYTVSDGNGGTDTAAVTITIEGENDDPFAADNLYFIGENETLGGNVIDDFDSVYGGDFDTDDNDVLTVTEINGIPASVGSPVTLASGALLLMNDDGTFSYDPGTAFDSLGGGESGNDSFTYTIDDGNGGTSTATVRISLTGVNDPLVAQDDSFTTDEDSSFSDDLFGDNGNGPDEDPDAANLILTEINGEAAFFDDELGLPSGAQLLLNEDGTFTYNPNGAFENLGVGQSTTDSFTYTISDGDGGTATATATVIVNGVNDAPEGGEAFLSVPVGSTVEGDILSPNNEIPVDDIDDGDLDNLTVTQINGDSFVVGVAIVLPSGALLTMGENGTFVYDENGQFELDSDNPNQQDEFEYTLSDGNGGFATGSVSINIFQSDQFSSFATAAIQDNDILDDGGDPLAGRALLGSSGDDTLRGGLGDDTLDGGAGSDSLFGGGGADLFVLRAVDAAETLDLADVIQDFDSGIDSLVLAEGLAAEDLSITETDEGDAVIALQSSGSILAVVQGVAAADISTDDIVPMIS